MEAAGEQAVVGAGGEGLDRQLMLAPPADAIPEGTTHTSADPAAQPAKKRSRKNSKLDESGTPSSCLPAACVFSAWSGSVTCLPNPLSPVLGIIPLAGPHPLTASTSDGVHDALFHFRHSCICQYVHIERFS